jgi:S-DNA-T family DNA segregation ATPase FtsK/SpoIIIE
MSKKSKKQNRKLHTLMLRGLGLLLIVAALVILFSVISFNESDPTFNNQNGAPTHNWLGSFGANLSCAMLFTGGLVLPFFALALATWGYSLLKHLVVIEYKARLFAFVIGVLSGSVGLNLCCPYKFRGFRLGGEPAQKVAEYLLSQTNRLSVSYSRYLVEAALFLISFVALNFVFGVTLKNWKSVFINLFKFIGCFLGGIFAFVGRLGGFGRSSSKRESKRQKAEPRFGSDLDRQQPTLSKSKPKKAAAEAKSDKALPAAEENSYRYPDINLLSRPKDKGGNEISQKEMDAVARKLESVLKEFNVSGQIVQTHPGPVVTLYELEPAPGIKTARVIGLAGDIARSMSAVSVRIAVVPGSNTIGIEIPNRHRETVWLKDLLSDPAFKETKNTLNIVLGKDIGGRNTYADLAKMPHLLVAGTTGSGKSVGVNSMILSLLFRMSPEECKLIMIDPKMLEFSMYNGIPHLLTPVITDPSKAVVGLKWAVREMEERYRKMAQLNVRNITGYNQKLKELRESGEKVTRTIQVGFDPETGQPVYEEQEIDTTPLPYIVIVVDEMADLMLVAGKDVEAAIQRLAQMARAAGLHLIMSTQRPSVDVITGTIKANFPSRISFQVTSTIDSRTILGEQGAEQLLGMGDMLYMPAGSRPLRVHGSFVKDSEVEAVVEFLKAQRAPEYVQGITSGELSDKDSGAVFDNTSMGAGSDEDLYTQAVAIVRNDKKASTSYIQRRLRIGYNRAAALIDRMEDEGIVSAADHVGRREIIG